MNEYTDWERTVLHPINTRDATISALSDAQYVAPLVHTGDMLSQPKSSGTDDLKERRTKSFFYVFDYQTRDGDYPQVSDVALRFILCGPLPHIESISDRYTVLFIFIK